MKNSEIPQNEQKNSSGIQETAAAQPTKSSGRREKKKISHPLIHIHVGFSSNNIRLTATLPNGDCIAWSTAGASGFSGSKKATPHAANEAVSKFVEKMSKYSIKFVYLIFKGISPSKDAVSKSLGNSFSILKIIDKTGYPFNGCKPENRRAV